MSASTDGRSLVNGVRTALGIGGIVSVIVGLLILIWPGKTAVVVTAIVAIYVILAGLVYAGLGIFSKTQGGRSRIGHLVLGALFIIGGVVAFTNLSATAAWFATFIGIVIGVLWIVEGVVALSTLGDAASKIWTLVFAVVSIIAGIVLLFSPLLGGTVLWLLLGMTLVVLGVLQIIRAFTFGKVLSR